VEEWVVGVLLEVDLRKMLKKKGNRENKFILIE
jgi:hypothetical protein